MKVGERERDDETRLFLKGIFMAMVPILMEPSKSLETVNLTEIALKFLGVTRPKQRALYHQALQLFVHLILFHFISLSLSSCLQISDRSNLFIVFFILQLFSFN